MVLENMPEPQSSAVPSPHKVLKDIQWSDKLMAKGLTTSAMHHQNHLSCQREFSVCYSSYPFVYWSCFMEANAPGDAMLATAQPKRGNLKRRVCSVDEKW